MSCCDCLRDFYLLPRNETERSTPRKVKKQQQEVGPKFNQLRYDWSVSIMLVRLLFTIFGCVTTALFLEQLFKNKNVSFPVLYSTSALLGFGILLLLLSYRRTRAKQDYIFQQWMLQIPESERYVSTGVTAADSIGESKVCTLISKSPEPNEVTNPQLSRRDPIEPDNCARRFISSIYGILHAVSFITFAFLLLFACVISWTWAHYGFAIILAHILYSVNGGAWLWYTFRINRTPELRECGNGASFWLLEEVQQGTITRAYSASNHHLIFFVPWLAITVILLIDLFQFGRWCYAKCRKSNQDDVKIDNSQLMDPERQITNETPQVVAGWRARLIPVGLMATRFYAWILLSNGILCLYRSFERFDW